MQGPLLKSVVVGAVVWLVVCIAGGIAAVARLAEYGSVVQLLIGLAMGLFGAASHTVLCAIPRFRRLNIWQRGLLNWLSAYLPLLAFGALFLNLKMAEQNPGYWPELAKIVLLYVGTPMLCLALLVSLMTSTRASPDGA